MAQRVSTYVAAGTARGGGLTSSTNLANELAMPRRPELASGDQPLGCGATGAYYVVLISLALIAAEILGHSIKPQSLADALGQILFFALVILIAVNHWRIVHRRRDMAAVLRVDQELWSEAQQVWERLQVCMRDGIVYRADSPTKWATIDGMPELIGLHFQ